MIPIRKGTWSIRRVAVNVEDVTADEGFQQLVVAENNVSIEPAGINFSVNQATSKSAVLESRSQIFFADFFERGERLRVTLSRPAFAEKVTLEADYLSVLAESVA